MFPSVDGGRSRIFSSGTSQGARHRCSLALMMDAPRSLAPAPLRGPPLTFFSIDGGRSRIFSSGTSQGAHRRRFLVLMVGAPGSLAPAAPMGPTVNVS
jgi:hypothetical protein